VVIEAGYGNETKAIHSGTIVRHSLRVVPRASPQLIVETADLLVGLTASRNSVLTSKASDSDVIAKLIKAGGGTVGTNKASTAPHETFVQYHATDWDLILMRAEASGCLVLVDAGKADIVMPTSNDEPVLDLGYGDTIVSLEAMIDAVPEYADGAVKGRSWSYANQKLTEASASSASVQVPGNLKPATLAGVLDVATAMEQSAALLDQATLQDWSTARLIRAKLAQLQGSVRFQGSALVKPGKFVKLDGLGDRFNGKAFVSGVRHVLRDGDWTTIAQLGMAPESFASEREVASPPAAGLTPPIRGLHTGVVKQVDEDPTGDHRVLVTMPLIEGDSGVWARLSGFYASKTFGSVFYPEIGDEVILGFMDQDPANPIILGSVYSSARAPAYPPNKQNDKKAIVTRSKMEITFDDKDVILQIKTPGGRIFTLDDKAKEIRLVDPFNNRMLMSQSKVELFSSADMVLEATKNMTIKAGLKMDVSAGTEYALKSPQIKVDADLKYAINAGATGEVKAGGMLTVQAALVKIN
jgi:Rhs element Vgr protein